MQSSGPHSEHRAAPPQLPALTPTFERQQAEFELYRKQREQLERRSMLRSLILIALLVLARSIARAGLERVFVHGWWRP
jgi:hypothetical protein